jgi:hypothetical protein
MSHKQELLAVMQRSRTELEAVVGAYNGNLGEQLEDGWRVRDAVAHLALWERMAVRKITGAPLPVGEDLAAREPWNLDAFNDAARARWRSWSDAEILTEFAAAHQALVAAIEQADEQDCVPRGQVWQIIDEDGAGHYHFHFSVPDAMATRWPAETQSE